MKKNNKKEAVETNDEKIINSKNTKKENKKKKIILVIILVFVIALATIIVRIIKNDNIKHVNKVLSQNYYMIDCLDSDCNGIAAYKGAKLGKSTVELINSQGKVIAKYKDVYDAKAKTVKEPVSLGKNYFIYKNTDVSSSKITGYSIANKNGKETYGTNNSLKTLTDYLVVMDETDKGLNSYSILDAKGKILFKNINDFDIYADNKIISAEVNGSKEIIDEEGNLILSNYYVATEIYDENGEVIYLLVEDSKNNTYNYFSIEDLKIVGDSFQNYTRNGDGTLTITKKENNSIVKYTLYKDGKQKLIGDSKTQSEIANELKKKVDSEKYNLYLTSIYDSDQKYIFADDIKNKTFGIYNIKNNNFTKIFEYKAGTSSLYSSISKISNDRNLNYYQISCSTYSCENNEFYIYNLEDGKVVYSLSDSSLIIQNYYQYGKNYKVIKYSYSSSNDDYKGKYVLYGRDNKEIVNSANPIVVIDEELLVGSEVTTSLIIYSSKDKKVLNDDNSLATKISIDKKKYYRYQTTDNTILLNEKAKEVIRIDATSDLIYSDKLMVYIKDRIISIFNASTGKTKKYKLKENEKMNDAAGDLIAPYRGALFINNSADNNIKILNSKGNIIKKIKKSEIQNVYKTTDDNVIIITKNDTKKQTLYGLYIAK